MKLSVTTLLLFALFFGLVSTKIEAGTAGVTFVSTPGLSVSAGVDFQTTVSLEWADSIVGFELYLTYNSEMFTIKSIQKDAGLPASLFYNIDVPGMISVNYSYQAQTLSGDVPLFTLTFEPAELALGEYDLLVPDSSKNIEVTRINQSSQLEVVNDVSFAFASVHSGIYGDVSGDNQVSIIDVGMIQLYLVDKYALSPEKLLLADVNDDGNVSIFDVGMIQMYLAGMIDKLGPNGPIAVVDDIDTAYNQADGMPKMLQGVVTYVDVSGFYLSDFTGSIYVVTEGFDATGVEVGAIVKVSGLTYMNGLQPLLVELTDIEIIASDPIDPSYYEVIALELDVWKLCDYFQPDYPYDYGFIIKINGLLSEDAGTYWLTDPETNDVIAINELTDPQALTELSGLVGEHIEMIGLTYDYTTSWRIVVVPESISVVTDEPELVRQTLVIPWAVIDDFEVSYAGDIAAYESSGNDYVYFFYMPEDTTEFYVDWYLGGEVIGSITWPWTMLRIMSMLLVIMASTSPITLFMQASMKPTF